jgi:hypothetical protein
MKGALISNRHVLGRAFVVRQIVPALGSADPLFS